MRLAGGTWVQPAGQHTMVAAGTLVAEPGMAWVGAAWISKQPQTQVQGPLRVVWDTDHRAVWVLLTDLAPAAVGVVW